MHIHPFRAIRGSASAIVIPARGTGTSEAISQGPQPLALTQAPPTTLELEPPPTATKALVQVPNCMDVLRFTMDGQQPATDDQGNTLAYTLPTEPIVLSMLGPRPILANDTDTDVTVFVTYGR
jgi:hypothetical protein